MPSAFGAEAQLRSLQRFCVQGVSSTGQSPASAQLAPDVGIGPAVEPAAPR
jgi:hypothetical protein